MQLDLNGGPGAAARHAVNAEGAWCRLEQPVRTKGVFVCVYMYIYMVSECVPTRRIPSTSTSLAGWPVEGGERGTGAAKTVICLGSST